MTLAHITCADVHGCCWEYVSVYLVFLTGHRYGAGWAVFVFFFLFSHQRINSDSICRLTSNTKVHFIRVRILPVSIAEGKNLNCRSYLHFGKPTSSHDECQGQWNNCWNKYVKTARTLNVQIEKCTVAELSNQVLEGPFYFDGQRV